MNVKDKGLVIITDMHTYAGIINIIQYAKELSGEDVEYICCIRKNMHLSCGVFEPLIPRKIDKLERLKSIYNSMSLFGLESCF